MAKEAAKTKIKFDRLDTNKTYGTINPPLHISGSSEPAHFEQNELFYTQAGALIESALTKDQKATLENMRLMAEADAAANAARTARLKDAGLDDKKIADLTHSLAPTDADKEKDVVTKSADIDLRSWVLGQQTAPFDKVQGAIRSIYGKQVTLFADAVAFLGNEYGLDENELRKQP